MTGQEAFEQWLTGGPFAGLAISADDFEIVWAAACEWQRSVCNEELAALKQQNVRAVGNMMGDPAGEELAALKQQGEPVGEVVAAVASESALAAIRWTDNNYTPKVGDKLYTAPPTCFSAGDMAEAQAKAFRDGQQS